MCLCSPAIVPDTRLCLTDARADKGPSAIPLLMICWGPVKDETRWPSVIQALIAVCPPVRPLQILTFVRPHLLYFLQSFPSKDQVKSRLNLLALMLKTCIN